MIAVSIGGRVITNLRFIDDIVSRLDIAFPKFGMEISAEQTKLMTNDKADISVYGQKLETIISIQVSRGHNQ